MVYGLRGLGFRVRACRVSELEKRGVGFRA